MTGASKDRAKQEADRLLEDARRLRARSSAHDTSSKEDSVSLDEMRRGLSAFRRFLFNVREGWMGFYEHVGRPIASVIGPPFRFIRRSYLRIWNRFAYTHDAKTGERRVSRRRSGILLAFTLAFILMFTPTRVGDAIRFFTVEPLFDGILILTSIRTETFFLNNSEEIDHSENVHSVRGCRTQGACAERDAVYFRVRPRLAHDVWKLAAHGNPIYVPDHVVAPIAPGVNKCSVTYYGYRMTSSWMARLLRSMQVYPTMLEASCTFEGTILERPPQ